MKRTLWRDAFFVFAVFSFACLLLGGGSRLIASPEKEAGPIVLRESFMSASLTCPPSTRADELPDHKNQENRQAASAAYCLLNREISCSIPQTDANGNVLRRASYMRTVYQAFALGDGFA